MIAALRRAAVLYDASAYLGPLLPPAETRDTGIYLVETKVMEVQAFRDSREAELEAFKKQYTFLKTQYASVLASAIREPDPAKQQELVQQVLQINTTMADELRTILSKLNQGAQGFNPKELNDLTKELITYQKEYEEIEKSKDRVNTLKRIHSTAQDKVSMMSTMYAIYIAIFIGLVFLVAVLVLKTTWVQSVVSTVTTALQTQ